MFLRESQYQRLKYRQHYLLQQLCLKESCRLCSESTSISLEWNVIDKVALQINNVNTIFNSTYLSSCGVICTNNIVSNCPRTCSNTNIKILVVCIFKESVNNTSNRRSTLFCYYSPMVYGPSVISPSILNL